MLCEEMSLIRAEDMGLGPVGSDGPLSPLMLSQPLKSGLFGEGFFDVCPTFFLLRQESRLLPYCPRP